MKGKRAALTVLGLLAGAAFLALGIWQVERRAWKLDLIERVEARIHGAAEPPPPPSRWSAVNERDDAYRRVRLDGEFLHRCQTPVQALTERGAGFWILTPLRTSDGIVFVNRGFVPSDHRDPATRREGDVEGPVSVTGLLRMSEPKGGFLRTNDPEAGRWYSRDVAAIGHACALEGGAPFFVDADATANPGGLPVGGLTVVAFRNNHLVYAVTWFALAAMSVAGTVSVLRAKRKT
ncbi:SURF1 family protein [Aureimonas psammosilenae]|uniref:SURF1 family protein n=1 Tax=Aureimonas psammosilenae TaxID=2495496 RepID=UPI001F1D732D|nr:SURF1 family protein [Aureimonas psammosilenae]